MKFKEWVIEKCGLVAWNYANYEDSTFYEYLYKKYNADIVQ